MWWYVTHTFIVFCNALYNADRQRCFMSGPPIIFHTFGRLQWLDWDEAKRWSLTKVRAIQFPPWTRQFDCSDCSECSASRAVELFLHPLQSTDTTTACLLALDCACIYLDMFTFLQIIDWLKRQTDMIDSHQLPRAAAPAAARRPCCETGCVISLYVPDVLGISPLIRWFSMI